MSPLTANEKRIVWGFCFVVFVVISLGVIHVLSDLNTNVEKLDSKVEDVQRGDTPATVNQRQARAKLMFNTCAKDSSAVDEQKQADFGVACEPYATLACAYKFEDVPIPADQKEKLEPCGS